MAKEDGGGETVDKSKEQVSVVSSGLETVVNLITSPESDWRKKCDTRKRSGMTTVSTERFSV